MTDQLQLRDWQHMCQSKAAAYAGTPEAENALAESRRYGMAADRIEELTSALAAKTADFDRLCKDFDAHDAELKRIIAEQRESLDEINKTVFATTTVLGSPEYFKVRDLATKHLFPVYPSRSAKSEASGL